VNRREFLGTGGTGALAALLAAADCEARTPPSRQGVSIVVDAADPVATAPPVRWAVTRLRSALTARGIAAGVVGRAADAPAADLCVLVGGSGAAATSRFLGRARVPPPSAAEALALVPGTAAGRSALAAWGADVRGAVYAVLELADRAELGAPLAPGTAVVEAPANRIRSVMRCFVSAVEDGPWYRDRAAWSDYLSMLAAQRFNRLCLAFGIGYNGLSNITDAYLFFPYPFLVAAPGHDVRAVPLSDAERDANLDVLRFVGAEAEARGLEFQLGLWNHGYQWTASPNASHTIAGLTPATHPAYCRDALRTLLTECPAISGVTLRVHEESGIPLGDYAFWQSVLDGIAGAGRAIRIDLHAKHLADTVIDMALATGMPVTVSPKFWAEHLGLPYQPASVRSLELPPAGRAGDPARPDLRYSYGDLLTEDRRYGVLFRVWPGTQRLLLWGDPAMAGAYGRAFGFAGSDGAELFEPLSFKGREGSGVIEPGRAAYADASLEPAHDWQKHAYWYRVWGRHLYDPDAGPEVSNRFVRARLPNGAAAVANALASASRILPLVTAAHAPAASNNVYWPEMYTNQSIAVANRDDPYAGDTPAPTRFGTVSPLDPELFAGVDEFAAALLAGLPTAKCSPVDVAGWLEQFAAAASQPGAAGAAAGDAELRRWMADAAILSGLGSFFAWKLRAGVLFALFDRSGDRSALSQAVEAYRAARRAWADAAGAAADAYTHDVTFGASPVERGWWGDRLAAIDRDIASMQGAVPGGGDRSRVQQALAAAGDVPRRAPAGLRHTPPADFVPGDAVTLRLSIEPGSPAPDGARLRYRHVNQDESHRVVGMDLAQGAFQADIPADFTGSAWPLQYHFELRRGDSAWLYPGIDVRTWAPPYFVVRRRPPG
jgi:hypothetical protein